MDFNKYFTDIYHEKGIWFCMGGMKSLPGLPGKCERVRIIQKEKGYKEVLKIFNCFVDFYYSNNIYKYLIILGDMNKCRG